ncbi:MAG: acyl carrier protein [Candidatus Omnitrophota bacterium]|jgi:acyl carrier protein
MLSINRETIQKEVKEIISQRLHVSVDKIREDSKLREDLGMDSFGAIDVAFALEDKYKKEIPNEDLENIETVDNIINLIIKNLS